MMKEEVLNIECVARKFQRYARDMPIKACRLLSTIITPKLITKTEYSTLTTVTMHGVVDAPKFPEEFIEFTSRVDKAIN
jgi:hypothetical protein